ncbi:hypothetical protein PINS_up005666 [Pythium insidiosum]|nr:hypothetical protein PINS_up005666 [Pythium insidiosum]
MSSHMHSSTDTSSSLPNNAETDHNIPNGSAEVDHCIPNSSQESSPVEASRTIASVSPTSRRKGQRESITEVPPPTEKEPARVDATIPAKRRRHSQEGHSSAPTHRLTTRSNSSSNSRLTGPQVLRSTAPKPKSVLQTIMNTVKPPIFNLSTWKWKPSDPVECNERPSKRFRHLVPAFNIDTIKRLITEKE